MDRTLRNHPIAFDRNDAAQIWRGGGGLLSNISSCKDGLKAYVRALCISLDKDLILLDCFPRSITNYLHFIFVGTKWWVSINWYENVQFSFYALRGAMYSLYTINNTSFIWSNLYNMENINSFYEFALTVNIFI